MSSVFDNREFSAGFIEFYESDIFEKYMVPFLKEYSNSMRDRLETASVHEVVELQGRIKAIKMILFRASALRQEKKTTIGENS